MAIHNNFSDKLKKILEENRPKEGNKYVFKSLQGSIGLPQTDTIIDPGTKKKITISVISGYRPNKNDDANRAEIPIFELVKFTKGEGDMFHIIGGDSQFDDYFDFLFLCRWNKDNVDKEWHIKPIGNRYKFKSSDFERDLEAKNLKKKAVSRAQLEVMDMAEKKLRNIAKGLYPDYATVSINVLTDRLISLAEKDPAKATGKEKDDSLKASVFVKDLEKAGIIKQKDRKWMYVEPEEKICGMRAGESAYNKMVQFINDPENKQIAEELDRLLKEHESE